MIWQQVILLAIIGALIGWMTNVLAIKLLFRPLKPVRILGDRIVLQGLIPKRREEIAESIGLTIETELLSVDDIFNKFFEGGNKKEIVDMMRDKLIPIIESKMPPILPKAVKNVILEYVWDIFDKDGEKILDNVMENAANKAREKISISELVTERINAYDLEKIEEMIITIAKNELKHIEYLGGLIGFVIGFVQGVVILNFM